MEILILKLGDLDDFLTGVSFWNAPGGGGGGSGGVAARAIRGARGACRATAVLTLI